MSDSAPQEQKHQKPSKAAAKNGGGRKGIAIEFQSDAIEIEQRDPPGMTRWTLYGLLALILGAITWSAVSEVDQIIISRGKLITTAPTMVVQPLETSVIKSLNVSVGEIVKKGQVIAALDPTFTQADLAQLRTRIKSYDAQLERLSAEREGRDYKVPAGDNDAAMQRTIYNNRKAQLAARMESYKEQVQGLKASMATKKKDVQVLSARIKVMREIENMRATLVAKKHASRLSLLEARNMRLEVERDLELAGNGLIEAGHRLKGAEAERNALIQDWQREISEEEVSVSRERDGIAEQLGKAKLRREMVQLTAPADAVVLEIAQRSIGSVVREAEALFTLVPLNVPLEIEAMIEARDIGFIQPGSEVRIKLDAFPFQKHGVVRGTVRTISEDAFTQEHEGGATNAFYKARIAMKKLELRNVPKDFQLTPGITLSAEIKVGKRTVISYFLYPLIRGLDESIREP